MPTTLLSPLGTLQILERAAPSAPGVTDLPREIAAALDQLAISENSLRGKKIAIGVGSRGIADLKVIVRSLCVWLARQGSRVVIFPAMGSHGGATAEGQRQVLEDYGLTPDFTGAEIESSMDTVSLGETPEGFKVHVDRIAWESDGIIVLNRVKPHTDFSGTIESGLLKLTAVGMGKADGAHECHHWSWKFGFEKVIRAMSAKTLATGKILAGVAVVENEFHQIAVVRAAKAPEIAALDEACLKVARPMVARIPFSHLDLLIVEEMGKNVSGTGLDTKVIGRGVELHPGEAPQIRLIYVRDLTPESNGNALGMGLSDAIHERLFQKIDFKKVYANAITSMNPPMPRVPIHLPEDRQSLDFLLGALGSPDPSEQRVAWIQNTLNLQHIAVSSRLAEEAKSISGWRILPVSFEPHFDEGGNLNSPRW